MFQKLVITYRTCVFPRESQKIPQTISAQTEQLLHLVLILPKG